MVKLLAKMFGAKDSELAAQNKPLWQCYLGRWVSVPRLKRLQMFGERLVILDTLKEAKKHLSRTFGLVLCKSESPPIKKKTQTGLFLLHNHVFIVISHHNHICFA